MNDESNRGNSLKSRLKNQCGRYGQTRHLAFDYAEMNESGPSPVAALPRSLNTDDPGAADLLS
jgi:hypothetical protein